jgi:ABC-type multidrug transport system permease subunit
MELFPGWLKKFALILPTTWAMDALHKLISWGETAFSAFVPNILYLLFLTGLFIFLGARFFRYE